MVARHHDADVAIIGGGPAGSAAAITCAQRGLSVIVLERETIFGERPGETMHPGVSSILQQLGFSDQLDRIATGFHAGIWIEWGGPSRFEAFGQDEGGPWYGFHVWRPDFDSALLTLASKSGADVYMGTSVFDVSRKQNAIQQVNTSLGAISARIVIDASGRSRYLARQLDIPFRLESPKLIARYGYVTGSCSLRDEAPKICGDEQGWTWTAKVRDGLYQWTRVGFDELAEDDWLPAEFIGMKPLSRTRGADVTWRIARDLAGENWFLAGDAATTLDPTSSRGVLKSIMTGMMCGHLADARIRGKLLPREAAASYQQWLLDWFDKDLAQMRRFYRLLGNNPIGLHHG